MDIENLWKETGNKETDDINRIKSWLCGSTEGQTYSIPFNIDVEKIQNAGYYYEYPESAFDEIVGFKHDYKIDDENLEDEAKRIYYGLKELEVDIENNPVKYFTILEEFKSFVSCTAHEGVACDYCLGEKNECSYGTFCPFKKVSLKDA